MVKLLVKKIAKKSAKKVSGCIIWEDKSRVCIMLFGSGNKKTGNMIQTYLLLKNVDPRAAIKNGEDRKICGKCPHRGRWAMEAGKFVWRRSCYVNIGQGVLRVYGAYLKGNYPKYDQAIHGKKLANRTIRIGSYGDPAFVPYEIWEKLLALTNGNTGYTHQWKNCDSRFNQILMASTDNALEVMQAGQLGYRSFSVVSHLDTSTKKSEINAILCVNKSHETKCQDCKLCNGASGNSTKNIFIPSHGPSKRFLMNLN